MVSLSISIFIILYHIKQSFIFILYLYYIFFEVIFHIGYMRRIFKVELIRETSLFKSLKI